MKKIFRIIIPIILGAIILSLIFIPLFILYLYTPSITVYPNYGPYLSITTGNASNCIGITFHTSDPCKASVFVGKDTNYGDFYQIDYELKRIHQFNFTNFEPNTIYHYILNSSTFTADYMNRDFTFKTAPNSTVSTFNFTIIGDTRPNLDGSSAHNRVMEELIKYNSDFTINLGDIVYYPEKKSHWDNFFEAIMINNYASSHPYMISVGNHECTGDRGEKYKEYFNFPYKEFYYAFNYSNVMFISLDLDVGTSLNYGNISQDQIDWLNQTLQIANRSQNINWIIASWHVPAYGSYRGNNTEIIDKIMPLLELFKVDLIFTGHNHHYERLEVNNTPQIISGGGGASLYGFSTIHPFSLIQNVSHHFCQVEINGLNLNMTAINENGVKIDNLTLTQTNPWRI